MDESITSNIASIILAGGKGTRLFPLTENKAKPAVSFGGRVKLIDIPLAKSLQAGLSKIFILTQHLPHSIKEHLPQADTIEVLCAREQELIYEGTADAVRKNLEHLKKTDCSHFLILSGDQVYDLDIQKFIQFGLSKDADLVIASLFVSQKDAERLGVLAIDEKERITDFVEKPSNPLVIEGLSYTERNAGKPCIGSMGIYLFKREALFSLLEQDYRSDFGQHLIPKMIAKGNTFAFLFEGYWEDIGTIESYFKAHLDLTQSKELIQSLKGKVHQFSEEAISAKVKLHNSIICEGAHILAKKISSSVIGSGAYIGKGSILENCVVSGTDGPDHSGGTIGEGCVIKNAIIDDHASVGNQVHLINEAGYQNYENEHLIIKDGIFVIKANSKIPDGFTL